MFCEIHVRGTLDASWSDWFDQLNIAHLPDDQTVFAGALPDQSALIAVISRIHAMNLRIVSLVVRDEPPAALNLNKPESD